MTRNLPTALAFAVVSSIAAAQAPKLDFRISQFSGDATSSGFTCETTVSGGPPGSTATVYCYVGNPFLDPFNLAFLNTLALPSPLDLLGTSILSLPFSLPLGIEATVPEVWMMALVVPPSAPALFSEPVAFAVSLTAPTCSCNSTYRGAICFHPDGYRASTRFKSCPNDTVDLVIDGVVVQTGVAGADGETALSVAGAYAPSGATCETRVNGQSLLGPIRIP